MFVYHTMTVNLITTNKSKLQNTTNKFETLNCDQLYVGGGNLLTSLLLQPYLLEHLFPKFGRGEFRQENGLNY
jgi:hypothetical protein